MNRSRITRVACAGLLSVCGLALWSSAAQPGDDAPPPPPGAPDHGPRGDRPPRSPWVEKYRDDMQDHPRMARSLVGLHETRDYLDKTQNDFGGHKATAIKACDDAIKELEATMKAAPKEPAGPRGPGGRAGGGRGPGGGGRGGPGGPPPGDGGPGGGQED